MNNYLTLINREFREHRNAFVITPLVMMALVTAAMLFAQESTLVAVQS